MKAERAALARGDQVARMQVVEVTQPGGPEVLRIVETSIPEPSPGEVLIRTAAASVNRPDIQQRRGLYGPPPGASPVLGLDIAGTVTAVAPDVEWPRVGENVCALTNGGAYAEYCAVPAGQCMPIPQGSSLVEAASLPEAFFTAWSNVMWLGQLAENEILLVQGGTSGVGMAAIQLAKRLRHATVLATAGTEEKCAICKEVGADAAFNYRNDDWDQAVLRATADRGVHVILDGQAGPYTQRELDLLAPEGRLVLIASHLGAQVQIDARALVRRRLSLLGSVLRSRSPAYKARIARELVELVWPLIEKQEIVTRIHATYPFKRVADAHAVLDANQQIGKVVLTFGQA